MCGICGITRGDEKELMRKMSIIQNHRGPDYKNMYFDDYISLSHQTLSIFKSNVGIQPISNEDDSIILTCNGEIYNYHSLKEYLEQQGHVFKSDLDVEVILHLYEDGLLDSIKKINGMFSFAIWDSNQNMLTLARDKFGIKPLYYTIIDNNLIFSSELKGILQFNSHKWKINPIAIHSYFCLSYIPNPFTIFQNIHKLPPGCLFIWTKSKSHTIQYIDIEQNFISLNEKEYEKSFTQLLINSIKSRISENWPIGIFLSGGIDSSTLAALLSQLSTKTINAYAMGFHDTTQRFCEIEYARQISENYNINLIESYLDPELFISSLSNYINFIDEPFGDYAIFPTFVLSKKANSLSKIIFSGEGSDELLNGYPIHIRKFKTSQNNKTLSSYYGVRNRFNESDLFKNYNRDFRANIKDFSINHIFDFNKKKIMNFSFLQKMSYIDCKHWLPDNLLIKLDISTMRNSIEGRVPYLDSQLANFLFNIPDSLKINNGVSKFILRKISKQYLPLKILKRRKQGFAIPFQDWYNKGLKDFFETCIYNHSKVIKKFFPKQYVQNLIDKSSGVLNNIKKIWTLFIFLYWLIKNISNNEFYYFD